MSFTAYGVDGCKRGWFVISLAPSGKVRGCTVETLTKLVTKATNKDRIFIDIPIGLPDGPGGRLCDKEARQKLGFPRRCSVFPVPARETLNAKSYDEAKRINKRVTGKKISRQTYAIVPKIKEVDELLQGCAKARRIVREVHPEVCFRALNKRRNPMKHSKKKSKGQKERRAVLKCHLAPARMRFVDWVLNAGRPPGVQPDDILDAMVAAITASKDSKALQTLPEQPPRDRYGLPMEIVYREARVAAGCERCHP